MPLRLAGPIGFAASVPFSSHEADHFELERGLVQSPHISGAAAYGDLRWRLPRSLDCLPLRSVRVCVRRGSFIRCSLSSMLLRMAHRTDPPAPAPSRAFRLSPLLSDSHRTPPVPLPSVPRCLRLLLSWLPPLLPRRPTRIVTTRMKSSSCNTKSPTDEQEERQRAKRLRQSCNSLPSSSLSCVARPCVLVGCDSRRWSGE